MVASEIKLVYKRASKNASVSCSREVYNVLHSYWDQDSMDYYETFVVLYLSRKNEVLGIMKVSEGGIDQCVVDSRRIFQGALLANSSSIIVAHNHPSGQLRPSKQDLKVTREIVRAGELLRIKLLDHVIVTSDGYYSMNDCGDI